MNSSPVSGADLSQLRPGPAFQRVQACTARTQPIHRSSARTPARVPVLRLAAAAPQAAHRRPKASLREA
ncbi:hypothetical protein NDU88_005750 [Pleurodeles waltl]|uniref:Uncharacterized protein n=1 Tax=Pleurodeles waltl TaxID=8319 RepID=A0AAV7RLY3_PLEWA|nr:hypothetical protein NDU88_005750 [Pleurodeles waltl]